MFNPYYKVCKECLNEIKLMRHEQNLERQELQSVQRAIAMLSGNLSNDPDSKLWKLISKGTD